MEDNIIEITKVVVTIQLKGRKWYQFFMPGWCKHTDGLGKAKWLKVVMLILLLPLISTAQDNTLKEVYYKARAHQVNTEYFILVDYSIPVHRNRMFLINFASGDTIHSNLVTQGIGDGEYGFSNVPNSHKSSLGYSIVAERRQWSQWGLHFSYALAGLDKTNSNMRKRLILFHSMDDIPEQEGYCASISWGCLAISNGNLVFYDAFFKKHKNMLILSIDGTN